MQELITVGVTHGILDSTPVMFNTITEGIIELIEEKLMVFRAYIGAHHFGAWTLSFWNFKACGSLEFIWAKDPITSRC